MKTKFRHIIPFCFLLLLPVVLNGQGQLLQSYWDQTFELGKEETVHAMRQSVNGWIVLAGEVAVTGRGLDGFFLVVDPEDGSTLFSQFYGSDDDDVFLDIRQADDGTFFLVGYSHDRGKRDADAWVVHVDEEGQLLAEAHFGAGDDDKFTHLGVLPDGSLLAVGQKGKRATGDVWMMHIRDMKRVKEKQIGRGRYENVVGTFRTSRGSVWLCGNVTAKAKDELGHGWLVEVDAAGKLVPGTERFVETEEYGDLATLHRSVFGNMLLAGTSLNARQRDPWMVELDENGVELFNFVYKDRYEELGVAAQMTTQHDYLLARQFIPARSQLILIDQTRRENLFEIPSREGFLMKDMLYTYGQHFIIAGQYWDRRKPHLRLVALQAEELLAMAKSDPVISCSRPTLSDENGDGRLTRGERGYILLEITNVSQTGLRDGRIEVDGLPANSNFRRVYFGFLAPGARRQVKIPVRGDDLIGGQFRLTLSVFSEGRHLESFPFEVNSEGTSGRFRIFSRWRTRSSSSESHNNVPARIGQDETSVSYQAYTSQKLGRSNFKVKRNGVYLEDNKNVFPTFTEPVLSEANPDFPYFQEYAFSAVLDTGFNEFVIEVYHEGAVVKRDTLTFEYLPDRPNLHVMVVGPENVGLKYNTQDALDFAGLMEAQRGRNYFNKVFIDTLVTAEETSTINLKIAFLQLLKRYRSISDARQIAPNDVLVVFISSHGLLVGNGGLRRFKIMASDYNPEFPEVTTVDYEDIILKTLQQIDCKKLIFIDACHSGAGLKNEVGLSNVLLELNQSQPGLLTFSSSGKDESSYENKRWENGAFTRAIEEAFSGEGYRDERGMNIPVRVTEINGYRLLSMADLYEYLSLRVPYLVNELGEDLRQTPEKKTDQPDLERIKFLIK